jgi:hypothetical protein
MRQAIPFYSDRIRQVVDNRVPFEYLDPNKIGVLEALCHAELRPNLGINDLKELML